MTENTRIKSKVDKLDLSPKQFAIVTELLQKNLPNHQAWAFGSRTTGRARKYSDLDIAVGHTQALSFQKLCQLSRAFKESDLDICVDMVDWQQASPAFRCSVEQSGMLRVQ